MNMDKDAEFIEWFNHVDDRIDIDESNLTPIQDFYKDAKIFVTGGTGFLGQLLIEKLLRSCPVSTIYLLVRNKKGKDVNSRVQAIFENELFDWMKRACPDFQQKVVAIEGDCSLPELGLSAQDKKLLKDEVNVVFHTAATIRFDEKLKKAAVLNVRTIRDLSRLAQQMPKLKSFVHVSTAFSNCVRHVIEEKVYPTPMDYELFLEVAEYLDSNTVDILTPYLIGKNPNTYIYTKQFGEDVVKRESKGLAAGIYRPAIVTSTLREPLKGWVNNFNGHVGVSVGCGLGLLRLLYCDKDCRANIVPGDMCINALIASAWDIAEKFRKAKEGREEIELPVYNYESTNDKPITWSFTKAASTKYLRQIPCVKSMWVAYIYFINSYNLYLLLAFFLHTIPAVLMDAILVIKGKKPKLVQTYQKIHHFSMLLQHFTTQSFDFQSFNIRKMLKRMSDKDKKVFFCDLKELDWNEFFINHVAGCRVHLVKDPISTLPQAREHWRRLVWIDMATRTVLGLLALTLMWYTTTAIYKLFS